MSNDQQSCIIPFLKKAWGNSLKEVTEVLESRFECLCSKGVSTCTEEYEMWKFDQFSQKIMKLDPT